MPKTIELQETRTGYNLKLDSQALNQGPLFVERNGQVIAVILDIRAYREGYDFDEWRRAELEKQEANRKAFQKLVPKLLRTHPNQYVAIHQQQFIDADPNRATLVRRNRARGNASMYIQKVLPAPRVIELDSPVEVWRA